MNDAELLQLAVRLDSATSDAQALDALTRRLSRELREIAQTVSAPKTAAPLDGAKSAEAFTLGAVMVAVAPQAVEAMVEMIRLWVSRQPQPRVKVTIKSGHSEIEISGDIDDPRLQPFLKEAQKPLDGG